MNASSSKTVVAEVLAWAKDRPAWQREAFRLVLEKTHVSDADIDLLVAAALSDAGQGSFQPEGEFGLLPSTDAVIPLVRPTVILEKVAATENVNAIRDGEALSLAPTGITLVFGNNGAGKTGYSRIIRKTCRARGPSHSLHGHAFSKNPKPPRAALVYSVDGAPEVFDWSGGAIPPVVLSEVSVFDSTAAAVYVSARNEVAFLPMGLDALPRTADVFDRVRRRIEAQLGALSSQRISFTSFEPGTTVSEFVTQLDRPDAAARLAALGTPAKEEVDAWKEAETRLYQLRGENPVAAAALLRGRAARLTRLAGGIRLAQESASPERRSELQEAVKAVHEAEETAAAAARVLGNGTLPLTGVGSAPWRALWDAALAYARGPGGQPHYPEVTGDSRCPLCQNPLGPEGTARFTHFRQHITSTLEATLKSLSTQLTAITEALTQRLGALALTDDLVLDLSSLDKGLETTAQETCRNLKGILSALLRDPLAAAPHPLGNVTLAQTIESHAKALISEAEGLEAAVGPGVLQALERQVAEGQARRALAQNKESVSQQIQIATKAKRLNKAFDATSTTALSRFSSELADTHLGTQLTAQFTDELTQLQMTHLPIAIGSAGTTKGKTTQKVSLTSAPDSIATEEVLSEGEHKCVALAAFLTEATTQHSASTLVFDDPVTSLDHDRREYVAGRLVEFASKRPVVVFTHELVFHSQLQAAADAGGIPVTHRRVVRQAGFAGVVYNDPPWAGLPLKTRLGELDKELARLKKLYSTDAMAYEKDGRGFYRQLRDCWEKSVEETLFNGVIRRYSREVQTLRLANLHLIDASIMARFKAGMTRASTFVHDQPSALNVETPPPGDLEKDLNELRDWVKVVNKLHNP